LQCRFYNTCATDRYPVLKLEDIFKRAVKPVGPDVIAVGRVDQLSGYAHPVARFAYRAFEDIADAQFTSDLLHIDRLTLVGEARIASNDEKPASATAR